MVDAIAASANEKRRLVLSDEDVHLLDFPNAPPITSGGFCELYVAIYRPNDLKLAMRRLKVDFPTEDMLRRFRREAGMWSTLQHANILPFFGTMNINHRIYIVSPWMSMGDLLAFVQTRIKLIKESKGLSDNSVPLAYTHFNEAKAVQEIATGLDYLHSIDVVHGDLKAKNVLLDNRGSALICDFGFTKTLDHTATSTELRGVGSIRWQSPELLQNSSKSRESDVYAFGMTIAEVLTGNYPYPHLKEPTSVIFAVMLRNERPKCHPSSRLGADFKALWKLAATCWETKIEERPPMKDIRRQLVLLSSLVDHPIETSHLTNTSSNAPSTPASRLPRAILQSIFLVVYESYSRQYRAEKFTMTVSAVCQSWRAAALGSSNLWSQIAFTNFPPFERQSLQIERSGTTGLDIRIEMNYGTKHTAQLLRLLRPHVARWRSLTMSPDFKAKAYRLLFDELRHEGAPMLETLDVMNHNGQNDRWTFQPFGNGAPKLARLYVSSCRLKGDTALFSHLTVLRISHDASNIVTWPLTTHNILAILIQCASTIRHVYFKILRCRNSPTSHPYSPPVNLPFLENMHVPRYPDYATLDWVSEIYSGIKAPRVCDHTFDALTLQDLVSKDTFPFPSLTSLTITRATTQAEFPQSLFIHVLSDLPLLHHLTIEDVNCFDHTILASLCDILQSFSLYLPTGSGERQGMKDMIEARQLRAKTRGGMDRLGSVTLKGCSLPKEEVVWLGSHLRNFKCSP